MRRWKLTLTYRRISVDQVYLEDELIADRDRLAGILRVIPVAVVELSGLPLEPRIAMQLMMDIGTNPAFVIRYLQEYFNSRNLPDVLKVLVEPHCFQSETDQSLLHNGARGV
jgi:hypothetical protein